MAELFPTPIWGVIFTLIIFLIYFLIKFYQYANFNAIYRIRLIYLNLSLIKMITFIASGFTLVTVINFILLAISPTYPINLELQATEVYILIIGGIVIIFIAIHSVFDGEFARLYKSNILMMGKIPLDGKLIKFCEEHLRYKERTNNPELDVIKFDSDKIILVKTQQVREYLTNNLIFNLKFQISFEIEDKLETTDSLDVAECRFLKSGKENTYFNIKKWTNISQYNEQIQKLKANQDFKTLKPVIELSENTIADKFSYNEIEDLQKTIHKLRTIMEE